MRHDAGGDAQRGLPLAGPVGPRLLQDLLPEDLAPEAERMQERLERMPWWTRRAAAVADRSSSSGCISCPSSRLSNNDRALSTETVRTSSSSAASAVA
jgi:hypothetical protein